MPFAPELIDELLDRAASLEPDRLAVVDGTTRLSYASFRKRVDRLAAALQTRGVGPGDRVAILDKNSHYYLHLYFALPRIGAVAVPLNYRLAPRELGYILTDSTATTLLFSHEYLETVQGLRDAIASVTRWVCLERSLAWAEGCDDLIDGAPTTPKPVPRKRDDVFLQMYTSGTTGHPKGAMLTHRNMVANTLTALHERDYSASDTYLHVAPLYHCADLELFYGMTYACGGNVISREFRADAVLATIEAERVTVTFMVPAMVNFLLESPELELRDISSLRLIVYGGAAIPVERLRAALARLPCKLTQGYGLTETSPILCVLPSEDHVTEGPNVRRIQSCGRPAHGVQVRIVDENDEPCPTETVGEIVARGENIMKGYWNLPDETAHALRGGWFHTGDMGYQDADGYVYIVDRKKDMIVTGGENVYPREVEEVIYEHPAVLEAAVIGVPDERWGETVKAVVVAREGKPLATGDIVDHCRQRLAHYKCPTSVDLVAALPRNPSGKVLKRELRERYWGKQGRRVG